MFTFGLFSTHMPYVVMVVFYALYFFFAAPVVKPATADSNTTDEVKPELVQAKVTPDQVTTHYYFAEYSGLFSEKAYRTPDPFRFYTPPDRKPEKEAYNSELFNRPPPSVS